MISPVQSENLKPTSKVRIQRGCFNETSSVYLCFSSVKCLRFFNNFRLIITVFTAQCDISKKCNVKLLSNSLSNPV